MDLIDFHKIPWILWITGVGSLPTVKRRAVGPKTPLLDSSWLLRFLLAAITAIVMDFIDF